MNLTNHENVLFGCAASLCLFCFCTVETVEPWCCRRENIECKRRAFSSILWSGLFVYLADVQDIIFTLFPSNIVNVLAFVTHDKLHIAFYPFFFNCMFNKLLLWIIYINYIGCTFMDAFFFVFVSFLNKVIPQNKQTNE